MRDIIRAWVRRHPRVLRWLVGDGLAVSVWIADRDSSNHHFLVATLGERGVMLYLDGEEVRNNLPFKGSISELALFGKELPGEQVQRYYELGR